MRLFWPALLSIFLLSGISLGYRSAAVHSIPGEEPPEMQSKWVDSVFAALTPDERIAQLIMVAAYSNKSFADNQTVTDAVIKYNVGGIVFFQGGPITQAKMTNYWQEKSKTPLFIAIDGEWGLGMRLKDSTVSFPRQLMLGAISDNKLIYDMGAEMARQCKRMGIHINFAPVVDVNNNPKNPVINSRSFGELRENVALKGIAYMKGMQDNGIFATAKHFPGHGDTDKDSHKTLPVINHSKVLMDSIDLYPFRELMKYGLSAVMVAHLYIPAYDTSQKTPSTLSTNVVNGLLRENMHFKGLIFTDALNMKGVSLGDETGSIEVRALKAGNDVLLMPDDVPQAIQSIKDAIKSGKLTQAEIDEHCKRVLTYKYKAGLQSKQKVEIRNLYQDLNSPAADCINRRLCEAAITLIKNDSGWVPLRAIDTLRIAAVSVGVKDKTAFQETLDLYASIAHFELPDDFKDTDIVVLQRSLKDYNLVILGLHSSSNQPSNNFGISNNMLILVDSLQQKKNMILDVFANPYALSAFGDLSKAKAIIISYQNNELIQQASAASIFGGIALSAKLPVTASAEFKVNTGFVTEKTRLKYTIPEDAGLPGAQLEKIDSIVLKGIRDTIYPGCQVLLAVDGKVIYDKSFGWHTYDRFAPVIYSDLYDLASLTKIMATTLSVMHLYEEGEINLDEKLVHYLPELDSSNKADIIIRKLMTHEARLQAWIPFYKKLMTGGKPDSTVFQKVQSGKYPFRVAEDLYIRWDYPDTLINMIVKSELRDKDNYRYSDLGFYLLMRIIEKLTNKPLDKFVRENFYKPLGLKTMCYYPRNYFSLDRIVPSEIDTAFRKQLLHGDVNDAGAAMFGGIGGHAGLFSNSNDVAVIMQMLLQGGEYGGKRYFKQETVSEFTRYQYKDNRRGIGFDKPIPDRNGGPTCRAASDSSFGHSGFTGTYTWADPKYNILYVFLANRTYPYSEKNKLLESGIRTRIQEVIYNAVLERNKKAQ